MLSSAPRGSRLGHVVLHAVAALDAAEDDPRLDARRARRVASRVASVDGVRADHDVGGGGSRGQPPASVAG